MNGRRLGQAEHPTSASSTPPAARVPTRREALPGGTGRTREPARSAEEAEARWVAAHAAWIDALHRASSGRSADLATLAIAQAEYEAATVERRLWSAPRTAIPVRPEGARTGIDVVVGQELAWRRVRDADPDRAPHHPRPLTGC
jgi:hypothetical protein